MKQACKKIEILFLSDAKGNSREIYSNISELRKLAYESDITLESLRSVIKLEKKIVQSRGTNKKAIEDTVFNIIEQVACQKFYEKCNKERPVLERKLLEVEKSLEKKSNHEIALEIFDFLVEIFDFALNRDSYRSMRRAKIIEVLCYLVKSYNIPQAFDLCLTALQSNRKDQILSAIEFFQVHFDLLSNEMQKEIIENLYKIFSKTQDRSTAVTTLQLLVEINEIGELAALSEIDKWKEKHFY